MSGDADTLVARLRSQAKRHEWLPGAHALVADAADALERLTRERDRLQHIIECADTPLMRDVLAGKQAAEADARRLRACYLADHDDHCGCTSPGSESSCIFDGLRAALTPTGEQAE